MKDQYFAIIKFPMLVSLFLIIIIGGFFTVVLINQAHILQSVTESVIYYVIFILMLFLVFNWLVILFSTHLQFKSTKFLKYQKWMLCNIYYYIAKWFSAITFQSKDLLQESFLHLNNEIIMTNYKDCKHNNILLLLPHCLQQTDCRIRLFKSIESCVACGACDIASLKKLSETYKINVAVATGGSLARKLVADFAPTLIIAVACHRDLVEGLRDSWSYPVFAILNDRPNGPCQDTKVDADLINYALKHFLS